MKPVRWGILSTANIFTKAFLVPMQKSEKVELYGIASRNAEKAKVAASSCGIPNHYGSYEDMLSDTSIEAVYIPLPNNMHLEWIKKSADAGKHILCEKPLTMNAGEAREAADYCKTKGVLLMEAFMYRYNPQWKRAKEIITTGNIGTVRSVQTYFSYNNNNPKNIRNIPELGGGALYDIGCYAISAARFMFGREPVKTVSLINRHSDFKTDILTSGILDFDDGHSVFTVGTLNFPYQKVDIIGTGGSIHIRIPFNTYTDVPAEMTVVTSVGSRELKFHPADQYEIQIDAFSESVRNGSPEPTPIEDAINNMSVIDAVFRSEQSGNWETV
ncbi:Gfo/Idh/MocA family protein [Candidatus Latescibacterota bacterium]